MERELITYLKTEELYPHPDNPRQNVGDVTELAESIKAKGILQNLTVVRGRWANGAKTGDEGYTIIIGHRRHAAGAGTENKRQSDASRLRARAVMRIVGHKPGERNKDGMDKLRVGVSCPGGKEKRMDQGDRLVLKKTYSDGSVLLEHRDAKNWVLATYFGYPARGGAYRLYPAHGHGRHYRVKLARQLVSPEFFCRV